MNAFGDATMALALFLLIQHTGRLDFAGVFAAAPHGGTVANLIALGLLGGAVAKSAQIPLHTWLPDAMEGPTPVSALIHAATMVTAGVYLIVRTHPLFEYAPKIEDLAAGLGAATLVMAGLIALVQTDIKRVIAYSTMSQIGYMFVGAAGGAYPNGMFHLMTHAFFKALLFLAAGIVIHALTGEQDIRKMGGLGKAMPHTRMVFLVGSLALVGIPPFAGFFSKDSIIAATLDRGAFGYVLFACVPRRRVPDGALHLPALLHRLRRQAVGVRAGAPAHAGHRARGAALDGLAGDRAGRPVRRRRLPPVRAGSGIRSRPGSRRSRRRSPTRRTRRRRSPRSRPCCSAWPGCTSPTRSTARSR